MTKNLPFDIDYHAEQYNLLLLFDKDFRQINNFSDEEETKYLEWLEADPDDILFGYNAQEIRRFISPTCFKTIKFLQRRSKEIHNEIKADYLERINSLDINNLESFFDWQESLAFVENSLRDLLDYDPDITQACWKHYDSLVKILSDKQVLDMPILFKTNTSLFLEIENKNMAELKFLKKLLKQKYFSQVAGFLSSLKDGNSYDFEQYHNYNNTEATRLDKSIIKSIELNMLVLCKFKILLKRYNNDQTLKRWFNALERESYSNYVNKVLNGELVDTQEDFVQYKDLETEKIRAEFYQLIYSNYAERDIKEWALSLPANLFNCYCSFVNGVEIANNEIKLPHLKIKDYQDRRYLDPSDYIFDIMSCNPSHMRRAFWERYRNIRPVHYEDDNEIEDLASSLNNLLISLHDESRDLFYDNAVLLSIKNSPEANLKATKLMHKLSSEGFPMKVLCEKQLEFEMEIYRRKVYCIWSNNQENDLEIKIERTTLIERIVQAIYTETDVDGDDKALVEQFVKRQLYIDWSQAKNKNYSDYMLWCEGLLEQSVEYIHEFIEAAKDQRLQSFREERFNLLMKEERGPEEYNNWINSLNYIDLLCYQDSKDEIDESLYLVNAPMVDYCTSSLQDQIQCLKGKLSLAWQVKAEHFSNQVSLDCKQKFLDKIQSNINVSPDIHLAYELKEKLDSTISTIQRFEELLDQDPALLVSLSNKSMTKNENLFKCLISSKSFEIIDLENLIFKYGDYTVFLTWDDLDESISVSYGHPNTVKYCLDLAWLIKYKKDVSSKFVINDIVDLKLEKEEAEEEVFFERRFLYYLESGFQNALERRLNNENYYERAPSLLADFKQALQDLKPLNKDQCYVILFSHCESAGFINDVLAYFSFHNEIKLINAETMEFDYHGTRFFISSSKSPTISVKVDNYEHRLEQMLDLIEYK